MKKFNVLAINPGSTSTKIAVYLDTTEVMEKVLRHSNEEIEQYEKIADQKSFRKQVILDALKEANIDITTLDAIVGRGGLLKPITGGTYKVNEPMIKDLEVGVLGEHASNLGGIIASEIAEEIGVEAFIVDPVVVDELQDVARLSGITEIERMSIFHALNQKAVARRYAGEKGKKYEELNLIVAHLGGGVSVGTHEKGMVIDVNNALDGDGAFSPERAGGLPVGQVMKMCFSGNYSLDDMKKKIKGKGGLVSYLNTNDARDVEAMIEKGDKKAELVYKAMAYQVGKDIGCSAAVLKGKVDAIILTGGIAYSKLMTSMISEMVEFIAPVIIYGGEDEMIALTEGALRVLKGEESAKEYK